jgi:hypothetical protein
MPRKGFGQRYTPYGNANAGGAQTAASVRVYVGNLSWRAAWQDLKDHMRGPNQDLNVLHTDIMTEPDGVRFAWGVWTLAWLLSRGRVRAHHSLFCRAFEGLCARGVCVGSRRPEGNR